LDRYNRSPLHYAALRGSAISGRYMIKMGLKVDEPDIYNNTPLAYAFFKHSNFSTVLIDNKADVNKMINIISVSDF
jgi:ankyrin repeat protein